MDERFRSARLLESFFGTGWEAKPDGAWCERPVRHLGERRRKSSCTGTGAWFHPVSPCFTLVLSPSASGTQGLGG